MYTEERYEYIVNLINEQGKITVKELSSKLNVSEVTIRRDLDTLDEKGILRRTFGGAIQIDPVMKEYTLDERDEKNTSEKKAIAETAVTFLEDRMTIYLDSGTTTKRIVPLLNEFRNLTIVTPDLLIGYNISSTYPEFQVILLGGEIEARTYSTNSLVTYLQINQVYFDLCFIGCDAFDKENIYSSSETRAHIKEYVAFNSTQSILLADSSKFDKRSRFKAVSLKSLNHLVTDKKLFNIEEKIDISSLEIIQS